MKKIKLLLGLLTLLATSSTMFGQQDPQFTQYMYNMSVINPAYVGSRGVPTVTLLGRSQWVGVEGSPATGTFSVSSPIGETMGAGLSLIYDQIGPAKETNLYADYSYTLFLGDEGRLAFGVKAGASFLTVDELNVADSNDPLSASVNQTTPNFGLGVYYYTNNYYVGFSVPNFLNARHIDDANGVVSTASEEMHYFLTGGYVFDINGNIKLKPSTMIKGVQGAPVSIDLSANVLFNDTVEAGVSYRWDDSISAMIGFQVNNDLRLGYAYDYTITNFGNYNSGSHEIILIYEFNKRSVLNPRFF